MRSLVLAVSFFLGIHFFISGTRLRGVIVARIGEQGFLGLFSLLSIAGLAWMVWAYAGAGLIDAKRRERLGDKWERFAAATSNLPFLAIVQGRNQLRLVELGAWRVGVSVVVWVVVLLAHPWLFGVSPWP